MPPTAANPHSTSFIKLSKPKIPIKTLHCYIKHALSGNEVARALVLHMSHIVAGHLQNDVGLASFIDRGRKDFT